MLSKRFEGGGGFINNSAKSDCIGLSVKPTHTPGYLFGGGMRVYVWFQLFRMFIFALANNINITSYLPYQSNGLLFVLCVLCVSCIVLFSMCMFCLCLCVCGYFCVTKILVCSH